PFEVPTVTVAPVMLSHPQIQLPDMGYNDTREASFVCWSATRPHFGLTVEEASHDPCVEVLPPRPLNAQELKTLPGILRQAGAAGPTRMLCGYLVRALVHEHRGGRQL